MSRMAPAEGYCYKPRSSPASTEKTPGTFFEFFHWFLLGKSSSSGCIQVDFLKKNQASEEDFRSIRRAMVTDRLAWTFEYL